MSADERTLAVAIVARRVVMGLTNDPYRLCDLWEDYPQIGAHDWDRVMQHVRSIGQRLEPQEERFEGAYDWLAAQAEGPTP